MRTKFVSRLFALLLIVFCLSCQNEENVVPNDDNGKVKIEPLTDQKIIAEIQAMASGDPISTGRTAIVPPVTLPPGYNYSNMNTVTISGTSWVTYVAYSNTVNSADSKELVAIYYQGGVYKNFILHKWNKLEHPAGMKYYHKWKVPESWCPSKAFNNVVTLIPTQQNPVVSNFKVYPPSACGQSVARCVEEVYSNQGWLSVGIALVSAVQPEVIVGVVGGCMLGCAMLGPIAYQLPC